MKTDDLERLCRRIGRFLWIRLEKSGKNSGVHWRSLEKTGENWRTRIVWIRLEQSKNILEKTGEVWRKSGENWKSLDKIGEYSEKI
ncbi:hypothetical protein Phum_PHUM170210 [Pediculus humanus corporis]|uniref:Uncharacterized protein n=1 Tax=Pediculus humanus subsp. corporis TaxID=121224 RepID=E0VG06_PEDHC|nr:uncharacterized protein Phum_PHUM170210 [Pediculus humanus corporis]EEB12312.1 hypothetical protein Phum_PHUM170210 [Pediculus humanus corporis]